MPRNQAAAPAPPMTYEPDRFYAVTLARSTEWKGKPIRRGRDLQFRGDVCQELAADIATAKLVPILED